MLFSVKLGAGGKAWSIAMGIVEGQIESTDDHSPDAAQGIVDDGGDEQCTTEYIPHFIPLEAGDWALYSPGLPDSRRTLGLKGR
jgi:hypothetical protein